MNSEETIGSFSDENTYYVLKGRFKSNSLNFYGLFLLIFNPESELNSYHIIISTYSNTYDLEPHISWENFEKYILRVKWEGNFNTGMTASLQDVIKQNMFDGSIRSQLYRDIVDYNYDNVDLFMLETIYKTIQDKNMILETGIQEISKDDFNLEKIEAISTDDSKETMIEGSSNEDNAVMLPIQLILAPVSGKPVYELKIGDKIVAKIIPNTDRSNYFIDLLNLRMENYIKPVACKLVDIVAEDKKGAVEIIAEIGPGIFGKCIEDERQVKVRLYNPDVDGVVSQKEESVSKEVQDFVPPPELKRGEKSIKILYIMIGIVVLLIFLFLYIMIM